ncbi:MULTISPECIES: flavin reductase family protein [Niastella]|uniref:Iron-sulfur cluster-binding domain-containing protein n=1 Tax=Niastella soli TaxID=2821487 RepID=A0ABS3YWG9_9BACT|nr:iron-sulfur cluster-binding domain-containing protein [Niastella soli]MBO9202238.1 iron-sulfur cluster-binding domain-containing protein [Niastella soli]
MEILQWKVIQVIPETPDAKTYVLEEVNDQPVTWDAGQSLTFLFSHRGHEIRRSYSICTTHGVDKHVAITVKKKENGEISRHILRTWKPGTLVTSLPPAGRFVIETDRTQKRQLWFIAAGSGIVPILALIKKALCYEPESHITLLYQNHDEPNIIYHQPLQQLVLQYPQRFTRIDLLSNPLDADTKPARLNNWLLEKIIENNLPSTYAYAKASAYSAAADSTDKALRMVFYTCGPEPFMRMVQFTLRVLGFSEDQLRKEHFVIEPIRKPAFIIPPTVFRVVVHYAHQTHHFTSAWPDTILQAAQKQGIDLPYSCNTGRCATCAAHCRKGSVTMSNNEVLTDGDLQGGLVLTCTGYATADLELDI